MKQQRLDPGWAWTKKFNLIAGVVERRGLENRCALCVSRVQIPVSPPFSQVPLKSHKFQ